MTLLSRTGHVSCCSIHGGWQNATYEEQKMTTSKPNRSDDWNDFDFDDNSNANSDSEELSIKVLPVHFVNEYYFEGYAE
jgi:hypothetical protein